MTNERPGEFDIAVVGGGLTGLTAALSLEPVCDRHDLKLALIAPLNVGTDGRTTALWMPSIELLESVGIWNDCKSASAPLTTMRMIDGSQRLIRAPLTDFKAAELGFEAFGFNIPNAKLSDVLESAIDQTPTITRIVGTISEVSCSSESAKLSLSDGSNISTRMIAAADGRDSSSRTAAGIQTHNWSYPQTALVLTFKHALPHNAVSSEFHTETGPFTQVPLPPVDGAKHRSSLVWVVKPDQAEALLQRSRTELSSQIEDKMQSCLGAVEIETDMQCFPLTGMTTERFGANRVALLGEAAHVFPPIGAQGLNLGMRDVTALRDVLQMGLSQGQVLGSPPMMEAFHANRAGDVFLSTGAVDVLNRSLLADFLPIQAARAFGLATLGQFGWLRRQIMQRGIGPGGVTYTDGNRSGGKVSVAMR